MKWAGDFQIHSTPSRVFSTIFWDCDSDLKCIFLDIVHFLSLGLGQVRLTAVQDSTDGKAAATYLEDPGLNPVVGMKNMPNAAGCLTQLWCIKSLRNG